MAILDSSATSTTDLTGTVTDFSVDPESLDYAAAGKKESFWYFSDATKNIGYLRSIPEWFSALKILAIWTSGLSYTLENKSDEVILGKVIGWGKDTFLSIIQNMIIFKKAIGDSFAEIIRNDTGTLVNIKPISPERVRLVLNPNSTLKAYDIKQPNGKYKRMGLTKIFHLCNDRMADEVHGFDLTNTVQWVIDARHEALNDERMIRHRELALGILEIDEDNPTKREEIKKKYADSIKNGEVLVLPKGVAEIKDSGVTPRDRLVYIQFLENFFYQACGVPRVMATSEGFTEAGGKVGFLTFQPVHANEQALLEADIWNQLAIRVKFNRPPSLSGTEEENEAKNTGQLGFQPQDTKAVAGQE